jgi:hypothetical protein
MYEFSNFTHNYMNADGDVKGKMALSQFAKLLGNSPKTIETAIFDADIPIKSGASKDEMIAIIKSNMKNVKLRRHLGTLIVAQAEVDGDNLNLFGKKADGSQRSGSALFGKIGKGIGGIFKRKGAKSPDGSGTTTGGGTEKRGFFGNLFGKRPNNPDGTKQKSAFGSWFSNNSGAIADVGGSLLGNLFGGGDKSASTQANNYGTGNNNDGGGNQNQGGGNQQGGGMKKKILIGVGILGVLGLVIFLVKRN